MKETLVVFDFDGLLIDSYSLLKNTFKQFGLNIGDQECFKNRRKFLKYIGGGKEFIGNLVNITLPKNQIIREALTSYYQKDGVIFPEFVTTLNSMIDDPMVHVGIISRNFTFHPGKTIRQVLANSEVNHNALDFVIPVSVGVKKINILEGMKAKHYKRCIFTADEVGDYNAASISSYDTILMASYGFDTRDRLIKKVKIPADIIYDSPAELAKALCVLSNH